MRTISPWAIALTASITSLASLETTPQDPTPFRWHKDLAAAEAEAARTNKPLLLAFR